MGHSAVAYLDASAFVKLVRREPETSALVAALAAHSRWASSEVLEIEALRAVRRVAGDEAFDTARAQLAAVRLLPLTEQIRRLAGSIDPPALRSLDAIHLATAISLTASLATIYTYDVRLARTACEAGLSARAPV